MRRIALLATALMTILALAGCGGSGKKIVVGSKNFTENIILGEMLAQLIEAKTEIKVERKLNLGGSDVTFRGLKNGDLDVYPDYDGTAYSFYLDIQDPITDPSAVFDMVNERLQAEAGLTFTTPYGFNNTYTLAIPRALADQLQVASYSDLVAAAPDLILGVEHEFLNRDHDGLPGLVATYGLNFRDVIPMETGLKYRAIEESKVQLINAFSTDGKLRALDLVVLQDDENFFPPYNGAPLVRLATLEKYPELEEVLNSLGGQLTDLEMQELNYLVDEAGKSEVEVAKEFLQRKGLIP